MAVDVSIRPATMADAEDLAPRMRSADAAEVMASSGFSPIEALTDCLEKSDEAWSVFFGGELGCMWGVVPFCVEEVDRVTETRLGCAWLLTSDVIEKNRREFWDTCRQILPALLNRWDVIYNAIDCRHTKALAWGVRLGFRFERPEPWGVEGRDFAFFRLSKEDLRCAT
jgi:hypothetical protein